MAAPQITPIQLTEISAYEPESLLSEPAGSVVVIVLPTYEGGVPPESASFFCEWLSEASTDFRVGSGAMVGIRYCVVGAGNSLYSENYNAVAKRVDKQMLALGAQRITGTGEAMAGMLLEITALYLATSSPLVGFQPPASAASLYVPQGLWLAMPCSQQSYAHACAGQMRAMRVGS